MTTFVLVHGAWHGGWCWTALQTRLKAAGHDAHALTLTGLGERAHLLNPDVTPTTHVDDVVAAVKFRALSDVVLVGHSYGGAIITGVAGLIPDKIAGMVYLDALVPDQSGETLLGRGDPARMARYKTQIDAGALGIPADSFDAWSDDETIRAYLKTYCTPHPARCITEGVTLTGREAEVARKLYILAERNTAPLFWGEYDKVKSRPGWQVTKMATLHDAMIEDPDGLANILIDFSQDH